MRGTNGASMGHMRAAAGANTYRAELSLCLRATHVHSICSLGNGSTTASCHRARTCSPCTVSDVERRRADGAGGTLGGRGAIIGPMPRAPQPQRGHLRLNQLQLIKRGCPGPLYLGCSACGSAWYSAGLLLAADGLLHGCLPCASPAGGPLWCWWQAQRLILRRVRPAAEAAAAVAGPAREPASQQPLPVGAAASCRISSCGSRDALLLPLLLLLHMVLVLLMQACKAGCRSERRCLRRGLGRCQPAGQRGRRARHRSMLLQVLLRVQARAQLC